MIDCDALQAEYDENEMRKQCTERLAIAERFGMRQGQRTDLGTSGNISGSEKGDTRDLAAAKAGLDSTRCFPAPPFDHLLGNLGDPLPPG